MKEVKLPDVIAFDWDEGNSTKSWKRHRVTMLEQEGAFFDKQARAFEDEKHSTEEEKRYLLFSKTKKGRKLIIAYTLRGTYEEKIRCISARPMNQRKEVPMYEKTT